MRKRNNSGKNRKPETKSFKPKFREKGYNPKDKMGDKEDPKHSENDPRWYASDPALLRDAASFPFSYVTGASDTHDMSVYPNTVNAKPYNGVAGVLTEYVYPTIGTTMNATDPINVAAQSVYSFVRHANSGHSNYDSSDLMIYILAMANMYSFLVWCQRLYGYALTYDQRNRYIPNELIRTNNVDAADLINNLANFRFWMNTLISKMASFAVPATMSVFSRMSFLYSDYYIEGTVIKDQLYQFAPEGFYQFALDSDQKGMLKWMPFDYTTLMSVSDIVAYGDAMFNAIWSQEDFGIMSGDVLKAYGDNIIKLVSIPEMYNIVPKFDTMVLTQMKNADLVRVDPTDIKQDASGNILQILLPKGYTTADTYADGTAMGSTGAQRANNLMTATLKDFSILTVDTDDPTPEVVIEATRLKIAYDAFKAWLKVGTEVVTRIGVSSAPGSAVFIENMTVGKSDVPDTYHSIMFRYEATKMFHYMPRTVVGIVWADESKIDSYSYFDIDNFTVLNYYDVAKLHEAAIVNLFAVPSVGKVM